MYAITGNKTQSKTYSNGLIIGSFKNSDKNNTIPSNWIYILLSRVPSLDKLWIMEKLEKELLGRCQPNKDLIQQMNYFFSIIKFINFKFRKKFLFLKIKFKCFFNFK